MDRCYLDYGLHLSLFYSLRFVPLPLMAYINAYILVVQAFLDIFFALLGHSKIESLSIHLHIFD